MDSNICNENELLQIRRNDMEIKIQEEKDIIMTIDTHNMNVAQL